MVQSSPRDAAPFPPIPSRAIILTGATAGGKSRVAMQLAHRLDAEIISLDSIAVYCGMNIGTAKPTPIEREQVPHHLLDIVCPTQEFSVAQYLGRAADCVTDILARGKRPLFVGGTPLYLKGLLYGFDPGPPADWGFRAAVAKDTEAFGVAALHRRLQQVDPLSAARLPPSDTRRITRALEVAYLTGVPLSHRQTQFDRGVPTDSATLLTLCWPRESLHQRIEQRVYGMFAAGLVDEVKQLLTRHGQLARTAATAVGYREVIAHLNDQSPLQSTIDSVVFHTRKLARHQETWFRSLPTRESINVQSDADLDDCIDQLCQRFSG